jgi:exopolysaccharide production protein ExoQ
MAPSAESAAAVTQAQLDDMGPLSIFGCRVFLLIAPLALLGALVEVRPVPRVLYVLPALGAAVIAPRKVLLRIQVSLSLFLLMGWASLSYLWTIDETNTLHQLREEFAPIIGVVLVAGMLPIDETIKWFVRGMKIVLAVSAVVLLVEPATRVSVSDSGVEQAWAAWFGSKNQFGRSAVLGLLTLLVWDKTVWSRRLWLVVSLIFVVGSSSAAALASAIAIVGLVFWVRRYQAVGQRWSGSFALASLAAGLAALVAMFISAAWVVSALGRDLTFTGRTRIWTATLEAIEREPLLGYGFGGGLFDGLSQESRAVWRDIGFNAANAHSGPLQVATNIGLIGLVLFFFLYLSTMTAALRHLRTSTVATWVFVFLVVQLLVGVVEPVFMNDWLGPLVLGWVLLAKTGVEERRKRDSRQLEADMADLNIELDLSI